MVSFRNPLSRKMFNRFQQFTLLVLFIFLSSCSHMHRRDGAPNFYVDETKIPNAVPKPEPLAKYGNMKKYRVYGKEYHVMSSSKNYEAVGTASWYGTMFHAQRTSSGEPYNMLGMTAAHKTLPLPTYVEVTNLKNNRKIIVKVNDRGPFSGSRLIDLSYVAAKKLGMLGHGTTTVKIKAIDPYTYGHQFIMAGGNTHVSKHTFIPPWQVRKQAHYVYLQVGAFKNRYNAEKLKQRLSATLDMPVQIAYHAARSSLYHVKVGPIKDLALADAITHRLKSMGIKANKAK